MSSASRVVFVSVGSNEEGLHSSLARASFTVRAWNDGPNLRLINRSLATCAQSMNRLVFHFDQKRDPRVLLVHRSCLTSLVITKCGYCRLMRDTYLVVSLISCGGTLMRSGWIVGCKCMNRKDLVACDHGSISL